MRLIAAVVPVYARQHRRGVLDVHRIGQVGEFGVVRAAIAAQHQVALEAQGLGSGRDLQPVSGGQLYIGGLDRTSAFDIGVGSQGVECHRQPATPHCHRMNLP